MGMERVSEILHEPFAEVIETGTLLKINMLPGERPETYRERVARAMQRRLWPEGKPYPAKMAERDLEVSERAITESRLARD